MGLEVVRRQFGLKTYWRYRDDIFIVIKPEKLDPFINALKNRARFYNLELEVSSNTKVDYLDLTIFKGRGWQSTRLLDFCPRVRDSQKAVPLSQDSAHPPNIHWNWPLNLLRQKAQASSSLELFFITV